MPETHFMHAVSWNTGSIASCCIWVQQRKT